MTSLMDNCCHNKSDAVIWQLTESCEVIFDKSVLGPVSPGGQINPWQERSENYLINLDESISIMKRSQ